MYLFVRNTGPSMSPFNAWVLSKSIETLYVRMDKHAQNALYIAKKLEGNSALENVKYPFLSSHPQFAIAQKQMKNGGGVLTFELKAGIEGGRKFLNSLTWLSMTNNLGDSKSLITHPSSTTHRRLSAEVQAQMGITPSVVRLSVGLEHVDDLIKDLTQAFNN
jgi:O-succinylhomoserine sulfhydrylase